MKRPRSGPTLSALRETLRSNRTSRGPLTRRAVRNRPRSAQKEKAALRRRGGALDCDQAITGATIGKAKAGENLRWIGTQRVAHWVGLQTAKGLSRPAPFVQQRRRQTVANGGTQQRSTNWSRDF